MPGPLVKRRGNKISDALKTLNTSNISFDIKSSNLISANVDKISTLQVTNLDSELENKQNAIQFEDEGVPVGIPGAITSIDFVGSGVTASGAGSSLTITIPGGGGGGAPINAEYVVTSANGTLTDERVTTDTSEILFDITTPGQLKAQIGSVSQSKITNLVTDLAGKQTAIQLQDEGVNLGTSGSTTVINFTGAGIKATNGSGIVTVDVPGSTVWEYIFGDGSDGNLTVTGATTLTQQLSYNNVTVTSTGVLRPQGVRLIVNGTLTVQAGGRIHTDGNPANLNGAGSGIAALGAVMGSSGAGAVGGANGANGVNATGSLVSSSVGPSGTTARGGTGGTAPGFTGGTGYLPTSNAQGRKSNLYWQWGLIVAAVGVIFTGGGGGGSGAAATGGLGGGGGGGASGMWISARTLLNSGTITANGGGGGNGSNANAGGGGGGGGGNIWLITKSTSYGTVSANGGAGGQPFGTGTAGGAGVAGTVTIVNIN